MAILEAETTGYGASGRNAGFIMTLFGSSVGLMKLLHGKERICEAHDFMVGAIDLLERMIADNGIDCDYERSGFCALPPRSPTRGGSARRWSFSRVLGIGGFEWVPPEWIAARIRSTPFLWRVLGARLRQPQSDEVGRRPARARTRKGCASA